MKIEIDFSKLECALAPLIFRECHTILSNTMRKKLINMDVSCISFDDVLVHLCKTAYSRISSYVCIANVHMNIEAYRDATFANVVNNAILITPDGMPIVKALKWLYGIQQDKVSGPDLMPRLLEEASLQNLKVFFYGSTEEVLTLLKIYCQDNYPSLQIAGMISPPFRTLTMEEEQEYIDTINNTGTNILFVALGCPKQEKWMSSMKGRIHAVMLGVGGAFPMLVGVEKRAPFWMQRYMLEWFYRLIQDPRRLFKRYFITNNLFIYLICKEKIKQVFF